MFLWLSELLRNDFGPMNVFRYVTFRSVGAMATALLITLVLYPGFIKRMRERALGEKIREELLESHAAKAGTPTMGGILILISIFSSCLLWTDLFSPFVWLTLSVTAVFGGLGFVDDWRKANSDGSGGVSEKGKLAVQLLTAGGATAIMYLGIAGPVIGDTRMFFPFLDATEYFLELPWWLYAGFSTVVIISYSNAVNLTDGVDGLAIGPTIIGAFTFIVLCYLAGSTFGIELDDHFHKFDMATYLRIPSVPGAQELAPVLAAVAGAGIGFLWYNTSPALVFMGDVGSLALGGAFAMVALLTKNEWLSVIIGGIFVLEIGTATLQRFYFKATGKRIFQITPIHHHFQGKHWKTHRAFPIFQKKDWSDAQISVRFWIISIILSLIALASLKLR